LFLVHLQPLPLLACSSFSYLYLLFLYFPCPVPLVLAVSHHFTSQIHSIKETNKQTNKQTQCGTCRYVHDKRSETKTTEILIWILKTNEKDNFNPFIINQFRVKSLSYNIIRHK
jgi:hypothetical protein